jgi:[acyl-carrier-protein] S-malonyltransferase
MDEAGNHAGGSTMTAVLYLSPEKIEQVIQEAGLKHCWIANYNSPVQCVISGTEADIAIAEEKLRQAGARRVIRLKVSGAFHSPLMQEAYEAFRELVEATAFYDPKISLYSNVTGKKMLTAAEARKYASLQIISPVRWIDEELNITADGFDQCLETGPGTVLTGLWKASGSPVSCVAVGTLDALVSFSL